MNMCGFTKSDLSSVILVLADARQCIFLKTIMVGASLKGALLEQGNFNGAVLDGSDFSDASMKQSMFEYASCKGTSFRNAGLQYASFAHADLTLADFSGAGMLMANLHRIKEKDTRWGSVPPVGVIYTDSERAEAEDWVPQMPVEWRK